MEQVKLDVTVAVADRQKVGAADKTGGQGREHRSLVEEWKDVQRARLNRKVFEDSSLAGKLVATQASPVYNARGELIPAVTTPGADL